MEVTARAACSGDSICKGGCKSKVPQMLRSAHGVLPGGVLSEMGIFHQLILAAYNRAVVRPAKIEPLLRPFRGSGTLRERSDTNWFPVEFLIYHDERNRLRSFAYVRREDGAEIPDGHYVF